MNKKIILLVIILLFLLTACGYAGQNLEAGLAKIQAQRTYQEFYEMPDWTSWTASEKANHITAKVFDMEKNLNSEVSKLKLENQAIRNELVKQENDNRQRSEQQKQMLISIVLLLQKR